MSQPSIHPEVATATPSLRELARRVTESARAQQDLASTLDRILADVETIIPADRVLIWLLDEGATRLHTAYGRAGGAPWNPGWEESPEWAPFAPSLHEGRARAIDRAELAASVDELDAGVDRPGMHFLIGPIRDGDRPLGVMSLARTDAGTPFTPRERDALETIAGLASIAIRLSLAVDTERVHRQRTLQLGILTAALNQARTPGAVAAALLRGVERLLQVPHAYIALIHPGSTREVTIHLAKALQHDGRPTVRGLDPEERAVERELLRTRRYIAGERLRELLEIPPIARPDGMTGLAALPIRTGTRLDGVLYLWTPLDPADPAFRDLSAVELETAETLCAQTAVALERTRMQELAQQTAHEQRTLAQIAARLSSAVTSAEMATAALGALQGLLPVAYARVTVCERAEDPPAETGSLGPEGESTARESALRGLEAWVRTERAGWCGPLREWAAPTDAWAGRFVASCPVVTGAATTGTLTVVRAGDEPFDDRETELVDHLCGQLGLGLQRATAHAAAIGAREDAERYSRDIATMLRISNDLALQHDLASILASMDAGIAELLPVANVHIYRASDDGTHLHRIHSRHAGRARATVAVGTGTIGRAAGRREPVQARRGSRTVLAMPMRIERDLVGVIALTRANGEPFTEEEVSLLGIFATRAASGISRVDLAARNRELYIGGIRALTLTVDAKDPHTRGHSGRVGQVSRAIAEAMALDQAAVERVELAGLLHDIGKIGIPDAILQKPAALDPEERAIMMGHTDLGAAIIREANAEALDSLIPLVRHHHEWWDGRGYPDGLRGDRIPVGAQIIAVADAFDTMTHDRPYRQAIGVDDARHAIEAVAGTQFAPEVVAALGQALDAGAIVVDARTRQSEPAPDPSAPMEDLPGQLGDLRALGVLVGLARITSHMADLPSLLRRVLGLIAERLDMTVLAVLVPDRDQPEELEAVAWTRDGYRVVQCPRPDCLDHLLQAELPAAADRIPAIASEPVIATVFGSPRNIGVVPLRAGDATSGALLFQPRSADRYWRSDLGVVEAIAPHVTAAIDLARMHERAREDALTDGLTGALNYRAFHRALAAHIAFDGPFALLMLDVVGLKHLNDRVGHLAGDELLRRAVGVIRASLPRDAIIARIGGDEFGVLARDDATVGNPGETGTRIQERMEREVSPRYRHDVALRAGWALYPGDGATPEALIGTADRRMYLRQPPARPA